MRLLRGAAWTVFALDLVILGQMLFEVLEKRGGPTAQAIAQGLTMMLGAGLLGVGLLLAVSSWLRSAAGLWLGLVLAAIPFCWVLGAIITSELG
jgi:hypothetical protein